MRHTGTAEAGHAAPYTGNMPAASATSGIHDGHAAIGDAVDPVHEVRGARSIIYSTMVYLLAWPSVTMLALVAAQALAAAFITVMLLDRLGVRGSVSFAAVALVAGLGTTAPWFASFALPDVFAATGIVGLAMLLTGAGTLSRGPRITLLLLTALLLTLYPSHLAVGLAMLLLAGIMSVRSSLRSGVQRRTIGLVAGVILVGALSVGVTGYIAFGEFSIAPKRYPLTLTRVIEIGPGRWYLLQSCPQRHYEICRVMPDPPKTAAEIVFGPAGLNSIATSAQLDRIRDEEIPIVLRATAAYPRQMFDATIGGSLRQLGKFGLVDLMVDQRLQWQAPGVVSLIVDDPAASRLRDGVAHLTDAVAWSAIALLPFALLRCRAERQLLIPITAGITANAVICATLSAVADRYQGRVMWPLPIIVCAFIARQFGNRREADKVFKGQ